MPDQQDIYKADRGNPSEETLRHRLGWGRIGRTIGPEIGPQTNRKSKLSPGHGYQIKVKGKKILGVGVGGETSVKANGSGRRKKKRNGEKGLAWVRAA